MDMIFVNFFSVVLFITMLLMSLSDCRIFVVLLKKITVIIVDCNHCAIFGF